MKYICENCKKITYRKKQRWSAFIQCSCGGRAFEDEFFSTKFYQIPGYTTDGYNEGLGQMIKDKGHYTRICKEGGFNQVG